MNRVEHTRLFSLVSVGFLKKNGIFFIVVLLIIYLLFISVKCSREYKSLSMVSKYENVYRIATFSQLDCDCLEL